MKAKVEEAAAIVEKLQGTAGAVEARESLKEGVQLIEERQKLIKIADRSDGGWLTAQEYETDEIADDSDNEKRIARAERQAEKLKKKRGQNSVRRGRGGSYFRGQYRQERYFDRSNGWQAQRVAWSAPQPTVRATSNLVCFMCGRTGHIRRECPLQKLGGGAGAASGAGPPTGK